MTTDRGSSNTLDGGNEPFYDFLCSLCKEEGKNVEADKYCKECFVYMCESCDQNHARFPLNKRHTLLCESQFTADKHAPLLSFPTKRCTQHPGELINIFCAEHDTVCCSVCKVLEHSLCTQIQHLPDAAKGIISSGKRQIATNETEQFILDVGKSLRDRKSDMSHIKRDKHTAEQIIIDLCKRMKDCFEELGKKSLDQVEQRANMEIEEIELQIGNLEDTREKAGNILRQLNLFNGDNECELFYHIKQAQILVKDTKGNSLELSEEPLKKIIRYAIDTDIEKYVTSLNALGSVVVNRMCKTVADRNCVFLPAKQFDVDARVKITSTNKVSLDTNVNNPDGSLDTSTTIADCSSHTSDTTLDNSKGINDKARNPDSKPGSQVVYTDSEIHANVSSTNGTSVTLSSNYKTTCDRKQEITSNSRVEDSSLQNVTRLQDLDCYENVSLLRSLHSDTYQSPKMFMSNIKFPQNTDLTTNSSEETLAKTTTDITEESSSIYDILPCHHKQQANAVPEIPCLSEFSSSFKQHSTAGASFSSGFTKDELSTHSFTTDSNYNPLSASMPSPLAQTLAHQLGDVKDGDTFTSYKPVSMMKIKVRERLDHHDCNIFDICQLPNGKILAVDNRNHKLKRFDRSLKLHDSVCLPGDPFSVCMAGPGMAAVALRDSKIIQFISIGKKKLTLSKSFSVTNNCRGMVYINGYLNVCTGDISDPLSGRIEVYNNNGQLQYCIPHAPKCLPSILKYITVSEVGQHRFVTAYSNDRVSMLDTGGNSTESFSHSDLKQPEGMCTDGKGQLFVCGFHSDNIIQISPKHQLTEVILDVSNEIRKPIAVHYDGTESRLFVSCSNSNELLVFTLK